MKFNENEMDIKPMSNCFQLVQPFVSFSALIAFSFWFLYSQDDDNDNGGKGQCVKTFDGVQ